MQQSLFSPVTLDDITWLTCFPASATATVWVQVHALVRTCQLPPGFSTLSGFLTTVDKTRKMAEELPECPSTPSLRQELDSFSGWMTPESTGPTQPSKIRRTEITPATPQKSLLSPKTATKLAKHGLDHFLIDSHLHSKFLPTPLTVGSGRKPKQTFGLAAPSTRSKSLTASLQALADGDTEISCQNFFGNTPSVTEETSPKGLLFNDSVLFPQAGPTTPPTYNEPSLTSFSDSDDDIQIVKVSDLAKIPRKKLKNPFVEEPASPHFLRPEKHNLDLSTQMEMVNNRTGERRIEKLTAEQQRFKPRKLDFTLDVKNPVRVNYNVTNKYIGSSIGKSFIMGEPQAKSSPGFNIFDDGEDAS